MFTAKGWLGFLVVEIRHELCRWILQALNVDHKWEGAPFAAMLRQHQSSSSDTNDCLFKCVFVLVSSGSSVTQVKHSSIVLQVSGSYCVTLLKILRTLFSSHCLK